MRLMCMPRSPFPFERRNGTRQTKERGELGFQEGLAGNPAVQSKRIMSFRVASLKLWLDDIALKQLGDCKLSDPA